MLGVGLDSKVLAQDQDGPFVAGDQRYESHDKIRTAVYDVACDARTFRLKSSGTLLDARRGDGFILRGKIYPAGTIPPGGTMENPGAFDPDTAPGSIGAWICRGTFNLDIEETLKGGHPHLYSSQLHLFNNGNALVHEGPEGRAPEPRALIGGMGGFAGAAGEVLEEPIGVNRTGLFNIRHSFRIKASSSE